MPEKQRADLRHDLRHSSRMAAAAVAVMAAAVRLMSAAPAVSGVMAVEAAAAGAVLAVVYG
jgi:hypothetical protein